ncbi:MAG: hypothetical protein ACREMA_09865 [Longimicrobiales bacterium]
MRIRTLLVTLAVAAGCATSGVQPKETGTGNKASAPKHNAMAHLVGAGPVVVPAEVLEGWRFLYRFVTEVEFVLCLEGERSGGKIYIEGFRLAYMEASNSSSVRYQPCTGDRYIGTAHNHPPVATTKSLCYQSLPDRRSFEADTRATLDVVLCGEDRFLWVVRKDDGGQEAGEAVVMPADEEHDR